MGWQVVDQSCREVVADIMVGVPSLDLVQIAGANSIFRRAGSVDRMSGMNVIGPYLSRVRKPQLRLDGHVTQVLGMLVEARVALLETR